MKKGKDKGKKLGKKIGKFFRRFFLMIMSLLGIATLVILGINGYVTLSVKNRILTDEEAMQLENVDCILVLGAGVKSDGTPSPILQNRISQGINLYEKEVSPVIIMSGDHGTLYYDEVNCMKNVAMEKGVPSSAIFMDHAGFCTYDSMYRAKEIFGAKKVVIITQKYHMYRAIYDARKLGMDAYGVTAETIPCRGQIKRDLREYLARMKDFSECMLLPEPAILGEPISLHQSGDITNDK